MRGTPDMGAAALWYATLQIPVFPLHYPLAGGCSCRKGDCDSPGKHPLTEHGFKDATIDSTQVTAWWHQWPDANIGIATGAVSGLLVVDCDPRNGGPAERVELIERFGPIPDTAEVVTGGGGRHFFFRYGGGSVPKTLDQGIDLKGDGGYVVAPPSLHASGRRYEVDGLAGAKAFLKVATLPDWLREFISNARGGVRAEKTMTDAKWEPGKRNERLTSVAGTLRRPGMSREAIEAALLEENRLRCDPPLPEAEVRSIAASVARYEPSLREDHPGPRSAPGSLVTRRLADIEAKPVNWLWPGRIARGKVSIIAGNPGLGKSQVTASIAATVTTAGPWPVDHDQCTPGDVVFLSAEDDPADTLRPRLEAAGADLHCVHLMEAVVSGYTGEGQQQKRTFNLQRDLEALSVKLAEIGNVAAVVIDPITAYLGDVDSHRNAEVRALLAPLSGLAAKHGTAIIGVSHLNKSAGTEALMRVTGSLAFVAAARAAYLVAQDPQIPARRLFLPMKNNIGPDSAGLAFSIESVTIQSAAGPLETSRVVWDPDPVTTTADEVMRSVVTESGSALREAEEWLEEQLDEPMAAAEIFLAAKDAGIARKTLQRASERLAVIKKKNGMTGGWTWSPPPKMAKMSEDAQANCLATFEKIGHLRESEEAIEEVEL